MSEVLKTSDISKILQKMSEVFKADVGGFQNLRHLQKIQEHHLDSKLVLEHHNAGMTGRKTLECSVMVYNFIDTANSVSINESAVSQTMVL